MRKVLAFVTILIVALTFSCRKIKEEVIPQPDTSPPIIEYFFADEEVCVEKGETTILRWKVQHVTSKVRIEAVRCDDGCPIEDESKDYDEYEFEVEIKPITCTRYTIFVSNAYGQETMSIVVKICGKEEECKPLISEFELNQTHIKKGNCANLKWRVKNADSISLNEWKDLPKNGNKDVCPEVKTRYTLTATNDCGTVKSTLTVYVYDEGCKKPEIVLFKSNKYNIDKGGDIVLTFKSKKGDTHKILGSDGKEYNVTANGTLKIENITQPMIFTYVVENDCGKVDESVNICVKDDECDPVEIKLFTINKEKIMKGESVKLSWETKNGKEFSLDCSLGKHWDIKASGSIDINCLTAGTITFTLTVKNECSSAQKCIVVIVEEEEECEEPEILSFKANKYKVEEGKEVTISWNVVNADLPLSLYVNGNKRDLNSLSGSKDFTINKDTSFKLKVANECGKDEKRLCVKVEKDECKCDGKVTKLVLQHRVNYKARIKVYSGWKKIFDSHVNSYGSFTLNGFDRKGTLGTEIKLYVYKVSSSNSNLSDASCTSSTKIHTSCSKPIAIGMSFGKFKIIDGYSRNNGQLCIQ